MTYTRRISVNVVTNGTSAADVLSTALLNGLLYAVQFDPSTGSPWSSAADFDITKEGGGDILHVDLASGVGQLFYPRRSANTTSSGILRPAGNASSVLGEMMPFADERARIVVASGGATTSGIVRLYLV